MKTMRDNLLSLGAACVCALSVVLAQDQAPTQPAPEAQPAPAAAAEGEPPPPPGGLPMQPGAMVAPAAAPSRMAIPSPSRRGVATARGVAGAVPSRAALVTPAAAAQAGAAAAADKSAVGADGAKTTAFGAMKFGDNSTEDDFLNAYAEQVGKTLLRASDVPKITGIKFRTQPNANLSKDEYLGAIEALLSMYGIVLEPFGDKFIKVLARKSVRTEGVKILMETPEGGHPEKSQVISQMIQLKSIAISEAQKALEGFKTAEGLIQSFERTNSLLVTDKQENINRMLEIVRFIDQPLVATEEVHVRQIRFAEVGKIRSILENLVSKSQEGIQSKEEVKANVAGAPGFTRSTVPAPTTVSRALPSALASRLGLPQPQPTTPNESVETLISDADRGMIRGKVQMIDDDRSNQLIIITRKENMNFFDNIITVLDVEPIPQDKEVEVKRLRYADAEEVADILNQLLGKASSKKDEVAGPGAAKGTVAGDAAKSTALAEVAAATRSGARQESAPVSDPGKSKLGALDSSKVVIIADKRINGIVIAGSKGDRAKIVEVIESIDIELAQVLIETVVLDVGLNNKIETGIDWVKRVKPSSAEGQPIYGPDHGKTVTDENGVTKTISQILGYTGNSSYRYGAGGGGGDGALLQNLFAMTTNAASGVVTSGGPGLEYFATIKSLRLDAVIKAAKSDGTAKVLSSPVLLTVDNKEATIEATELKYMYKGMRYMGYSGGGTSGYGGGSYEPDIEQRDVGITVKVTPRINPDRNVMLSVEETFEIAVDNAQEINGQSWPSVKTRKLSADVSVGSGETVILGGLVKTEKGHSEAGIPVLKDIPYIGKYLFGSVSDSEARSELLVFLTPYVINSPLDMDLESRRRRDYLDASGIWTKGWSNSKLADPVSETEMRRRLARKTEQEKVWRSYRKALEEDYKIEDKLFEARTRTDTLMSLKEMEAAAREYDAAHNGGVRWLDNAKPAEETESKEGEPVRPEVEDKEKPWWKIF